MRTIAFYLPQFHAIPENDQWWGPGFTEWTNTERAHPFYAGHRQPRRPGELGQYSLLSPFTLRAQSDLAMSHGLDGFCIYFYWFSGRRLLERPLELWAKDASLSPYCLSWANESWTRRWDGKHREVLMDQDYFRGYEAELFEDLLPHFRSERYLRVQDHPILVVHRPMAIPNVVEFAHRMRALATSSGLSGLHLVGAETVTGLDPRRIGFDAVTEFPPVGSNTLRSAMLRPVRGVDAAFRGRLMSYPRTAERFMSRREPDFTRYSGVMPGWDNTARRMCNATVYCDESPLIYGKWLAHARKRESDLRGEDGLVFINAWNEWAEGAYLEPDDHLGRAYLDATASTVSNLSDRTHSQTTSRGLFWQYPQVRSLAVASIGSLLAFLRRVQAQVRRPYRERSAIRRSI